MTQFIDTNLHGFFKATPYLVHKDCFFLSFQYIKKTIKLLNYRKTDFLQIENYFVWINFLIFVIMCIFAQT